MIEEKFKAREVQPTVLRLGPELRAELMRVAFINGRSLTKEIAARLHDSLKRDATQSTAQSIAPAPIPNTLPASYTAAHTPTVHPTNNNGPANALTDIDRAMLAVFHTLPPEKQLALLSLFR